MAAADAVELHRRMHTALCTVIAVYPQRVLRVLWESSFAGMRCSALRPPLPHAGANHSAWTIVRLTTVYCDC